MAGDRACSSSCAFRRDIPPLAHRSVLIVVPQIRVLNPGMMSPLGPFSLKRTVFFLRQQHFSLTGL